MNGCTKLWSIHSYSFITLLYRCWNHSYYLPWRLKWACSEVNVLPVEMKVVLWAVKLHSTGFVVESSNIGLQAPLLKVTVLIWLLLCGRWAFCNKQEQLFMEMTSWAISETWAWADSHQNNDIFGFRANNDVFSLSKDELGVSLLVTAG